MTAIKSLTVMLKPASSLCNLRCRYCFYEDLARSRTVSSFGIMTPETRSRVLAGIHKDLRPGDQICFAFQGGEPTLAGLDWFRDFVQETEHWQGIGVSYTLQTNGILLDGDWCRFLREKDFLVGLSWDVLGDCHDAVRVDPQGRGTNEKIRSAMALLRQHGVEFNILCTLTRQIAAQAEAVWAAMKEADIRFIQFTPCLGPLEGTEDPYALTPADFAAFYKTLFPLWLADFVKDDYRSVKLIDDVVNLLAYGRPTACGIRGLCSPQMVVEADGSAYPCDFYCLDETKLGSLTRQSIGELMQSEAMRAFLTRDRNLPNLCGNCPFLHFCGGGCIRMRQQVYCAPDGDQCGYRMFLESCAGELMTIARSQRGY